MPNMANIISYGKYAGEAELFSIRDDPGLWVTHEMPIPPAKWFTVASFPHIPFMIQEVSREYAQQVIKEKGLESFPVPADDENPPKPGN